MIFYYIRHGQPIYAPDSLTPYGVLQAEALSKLMEFYGVDKIYSSTSNRAIMTAKPTCDLLGLEPELLDFANEHYAWLTLSTKNEDGSVKGWLHSDPKAIDLFGSKEIRDLGENWHTHPEFQNCGYDKAIERIALGADAFFKDLGYEHIKNTGKYKVIKENNQKIALFAHQGFGLAFLSYILDIPYPMFCRHFDLSHSSVTLIEFKEIDGVAVPKILTMSAESHLFKTGLLKRLK